MTRRTGWAAKGFKPGTKVRARDVDQCPQRLQTQAPLFSHSLVRLLLEKELRVKRKTRAICSQYVPIQFASLLSEPGAVATGLLLAQAPPPALVRTGAVATGLLERGHLVRRNEVSTTLR